MLLLLNEEGEAEMQPVAVSWLVAAQQEKETILQLAERAREHIVSFPKIETIKLYATTQW